MSKTVQDETIDLNLSFYIQSFDKKDIIITHNVSIYYRICPLDVLCKELTMIFKHLNTKEFTCGNMFY